MDSLGLRLVQSLLHEKDLVKFTESGLTKYDLFGDAREGFEWVEGYVHSTREWPTPRMLEENTGITLKGELDSFSYICDSVRKRSLGKSLEVGLRSVIDLLEERHPDEALSKLKDLAYKPELDRGKVTVSSYRKSAKDRFKTYMELKDKDGFSGILTPWDTLNLGIQGWVNGTLNVLIAMQSSGKTWLLCVIANRCLQLGEKVLFVTMEMNIPRMQRRIDALRYKIPFGKLRDIKLDDERYLEKRLRDDEEGEGDIVFADKKLVRHVSDVSALVSEYSPTIVIIDGGYRFQGSGKGDWEQTKRVVADLQLAAEITDIPWIVSTQYGDSQETGKERKRGPKLHSWGVRYGKEWVINPDTVIGLYQNEDLRIMNMNEIHILKMRDAAGGNLQEFRINWDQTTMDFSEIVREEEKTDEEILVEY